MALGDGRGVFRALPPRARPLAAEARLARFPIAGGARLAAFLSIPGAGGDTLRGEWAVVTPQGALVARGARALAPSACDPAHRQTAEFSAGLPPGDYRVDLVVWDARGGRGLAHLAARVEAAPERLALSDLVLLCRAAPVPEGARELRLDPDLDGRVGATRSLSVYFEVSGLAVGADGVARFAYAYAVRPRAKPKRGSPRPEPVLAATREESYAGRLRRQFLTVALPALSPGEYELEIEVRDLAAGTAATGSLRFER